MIEKIILFASIGSFIVFVVSMINLEEYIQKKYKKQYKKYFDDFIARHAFWRGFGEFTVIRLFFSNPVKNDTKIKTNLIIYRISFLVFIIMIIIYLQLTR